MLSAEQRAHDLALSFVNYKLNIEIQNTDAEHDETLFFEMYKEAFDSFFEMLTEGT